VSRTLPNRRWCVGLLAWLVLAGCLPLGVGSRNAAVPANTPSASGSSKSGAKQTPPGPATTKDGDHSPRALLAQAQWMRRMPEAEKGDRSNLCQAPGGPLRGKLDLSPFSAQSPPPWRWRHAGLEELQARHVDLSAFLTDRETVVATNAAIGLACSGSAGGRGTPGYPGARAERVGGSVGRRLVAAAGASDLPVPMRSAAIEALAALPSPVAVRPLRDLTDRFGDPGPAGAATYRAELHAELIRGLARHVDAESDPRLSAALAGPSAEVRIAALGAWARGREGILPREAVALRNNADPRVRAAALGAIAACRHPQAQQYLTEALRDSELSVRRAAIAALGVLGGSEARATLAGLLSDRSELIRAEAVAALDRAGAKASVLGAAGDASWRVRLEVARAVAGYPDRDGISVARRLLDDPSAEVQRSAALAVGHWPLAQGGPVLLEAMGKPALWTRRTAMEQLAARWPAASDFPLEAAAPRRQEALAELHARFRRQLMSADVTAAVAGTAGSVAPGTGQPPARTGMGPMGPISLISPDQPLARTGPAAGASPPDAAALRQVDALVQSGDVKALAQWGPGIAGLLEHLAIVQHRVLPAAVYRDVLPQHSPAFAALVRLESPSLGERRQAAAELVGLAGKQPLTALAVARLGELIAPESDAVVWQSALEAVAADPSEPAVRMARTALGHASPEVRRRGCEHLAAHPDAGHARHLVPVLQDGSQGVVVAAIRALGAIDSLDDLRPLRRLLASASEEIQLEAGAALARFHDPAGMAALDRLTYSDDPRIRTRTARVMGELGDPSFAAALVRLLDDRRASVTHAALTELPKVAGRDVAQAADGSPRDSQEQIRRWKQWLAAPRPSP